MGGQSSAFRFSLFFVIFLMFLIWQWSAGIFPFIEPKETRDAKVIAGPLPVRLGQGFNTLGALILQCRCASSWLVVVGVLEGHVAFPSWCVVRLQIAAGKDRWKRFPCRCMKRRGFSDKLLSGVLPGLLFRCCKAGKRVYPISKAGPKRPSAAHGHTPFPKSLFQFNSIIGPQN